MSKIEMLQIYLSASELLQSAAIWLASDGQILGANKLFSNELGYTQVELKEKSIFQINPRLNLIDWRKIWKELEAKGSTEIQSDHITADGRIYPIQMQAVMIDTGNDRVCIGIVKNMMALSRYRDMLELVTKMTHIGAYEWDLVSNELVLTDEVYNILETDRTSQPVNQTNFLETMGRLLSTEDLHVLRRKARISMSTGEAVEMALTLHLSEDRQKHIVLYIHPINNEETTSKVFGAVHDVTLQKQAIHPLEMTKFAIDNATEMVYWVNQDGQITYANHAFVKCMGYEDEEITTVSILDLIPDLNREAWNGLFGVLQRDKYLKVELSKRRKDGSLVPVEVIANYMEYEGQPFMCKYVRDLSEAKKAEAERQAQAQNLQKAIEEISNLKKQLELENSYLQSEIDLQYNFNNIITSSDRYKKVLQQIEQVADSDATVLITGETGTGKELLARAIHSNSARSKKQMIKVNCAALPENLIESELFGHERGAFTGALQRKPGRFELAHRSTLFLDEVGEMPLDVQAKLLRVLQEGEFERVGGTETLRCDVRVIAATNRDLLQMMREGKFREDLYYRLNVFPIHNIPLRERPEDVPLLIRHFVKKFAEKTGKSIPKIPSKVFETLAQYNFPGNIRELENIIERSVILSAGDSLVFDAAPFKIKASQHSFEDVQLKTLEEMQRDYIKMALSKTQGRVSGPDGAARILGLPDKTLFSKMAKLGIHT